MRRSGQCYHRRNTRTHNCHPLYQNTPAFAPPVDQRVAVSTRTAWQTQRGSHSSISRRIEWTNNRTEYVPPLKKTGRPNGDHRILCPNLWQLRMKSTKRSAWRLARLYSSGAGLIDLPTSPNHPRWRQDSGVSASPIRGG